MGSNFGGEKLESAGREKGINPDLWFIYRLLCFDTTFYFHIWIEK
jgi:hypothetical protein